MTFMVSSTTQIFIDRTRVHDNGRCAGSRRYRHDTAVIMIIDMIAVGKTQVDAQAGINPGKPAKAS
jgi:hypothetical protein